MCHYHLIPLFTLLFCIPYSLKKPHLIYIMLPKDLGHINYFLGMEAHASVMTLLYCSPYILDLLKRAKMDGANPCATPMPAGTPLSKCGSTPPHLYRSRVSFHYHKSGY